VSGFEVTAVELQVCGMRLAQLGGEVRNRLEQIGQEVDGLLGSGWRGRASAGFGDGWRQWRSGADEVIDGLSRMAELLSAAGRDYDGAEQQATATVTQAWSTW
jgi:WXG100 family type VII secretion target